MQSSHRSAVSNDLYSEALMRSFGPYLPPWLLAAAPLEWHSNMTPASHEKVLSSSIRPAGSGTHPQIAQTYATLMWACLSTSAVRDFEQENSALRAQLSVFDGACMRRLDALEMHMTHLMKALKSATDLKNIPSNVDESVATAMLALSAIEVPPLVQLERAQCPKTTYYEQNDWIIAKKEKPKPTSTEPAKRGKAYISQNVNATMLYVTDEDGRPVDGQRTVEIRETFRALLRQLHLLKLLTPKWGQLPFAARQFVFYHMTQMFRELGWCRGNRKVEQIAADNYSRFAKDLLREVDDAQHTATKKGKERPIPAELDDCDIEELPPSSDPPDDCDFAPEGNDDADDQSANASAIDEPENNMEDMLELPAKRGAVDEANGQPDTKRTKTSIKRTILSRPSPSAHSMFDGTASERNPSNAHPQATQDFPSSTTSAMPTRSASRRTLTIANTMLDLRLTSPSATFPTTLSAADPGTSADPTSPLASDSGSSRCATTLIRSRSSFHALPPSAARKSVTLAARDTRTSSSRTLAQDDSDSGDDSDVYVVRLGTHGVGWRSIVGLDFMRDHRNGTTSQFNAYIGALTKREKAEAKRRASEADLAEMKKLVKVLTTKPKKVRRESDCA
ncbi:uncharacterized protein SCHCODRAFT_01190859 [Schizophyllum commune H4-8]|nr:uncharacterized protein SCHCODRAFT_01190859 [Schizophyllum commune H4-8]KAI5890220.1 hypothetical protein SCHCODRAFT_01190859 [Schizophyllum commune H4-8]